MKREIVKINEELCNGCGICIPACHEGALQIIDGKARLVSDLMCDGLGACLGECPLGAISIETREAEPYDEIKVIEIMADKGINTVHAHLKHLEEHGETVFYNQAVEWLNENRPEMVPGREKLAMAEPVHVASSGCGCPSATPKTIKPGNDAAGDNGSPVPSRLQNWPVQLHLANPAASYFKNADLLLAADCSAFAAGDFHNRFMKNKVVVIACPKLDQGKEIYLQKIISLIEDARVNTITVVTMEVPCCSGLTQLTRIAAENASVKVPVKSVMLSVSGEVLKEQWI